ncbi:trypsin-like serine protease [Micromonospora sp. WMMC415]|uniref:trypsin-like serine protease n=1 Tax=Micromonospora sp. WMMC415 TaxID=2675222 RepID=UPI00351A9924
MRICARPGDSGGPLFTESDGRAVGIVSYGDRAAAPAPTPTSATSTRRSPPSSTGRTPGPVEPSASSWPPVARCSCGTRRCPGRRRTPDVRPAG